MNVAKIMVARPGASALLTAACLLAFAALVPAQTAAQGQTSPPAMTPAQAQALAENSETQAPPPAVAVNPDKHVAVTDNVMQALMDDPVLGDISITVNTMDDGTVSLNGVVSTQALVDRAVQVAKSVPGVNQVVSRILVNQDAFAAASPALQAVVPESSAPAASLLPATSSPKAEAEAALDKDPVLGPRVSVDVNGSRMTVIGSVPAKSDDARAMAIVHRAAPGLKLQDLIWVNTDQLAPPPLVPR